MQKIAITAQHINDSRDSANDYGNSTTSLYCIIDENGGTIGSDSCNTLCLQDKQIKSQHVSIQYEEGCFTIASIEDSDIFYNNSFSKLLSGYETTIELGDTFKIGDYKCSVIDPKDLNEEYLNTKNVIKEVANYDKLDTLQIKPRGQVDGMNIHEMPMEDILHENKILDDLINITPNDFGFKESQNKEQFMQDSAEMKQQSQVEILMQNKHQNAVQTIQQNKVENLMQNESRVENGRQNENQQDEIKKAVKNSSKSNLDTMNNSTSNQGVAKEIKKEQRFTKQAILTFLNNALKDLYDGERISLNTDLNSITKTTQTIKTQQDFQDFQESQILQDSQTIRKSQTITHQDLQDILQGDLIIDTPLLINALAIGIIYKELHTPLFEVLDNDILGATLSHAIKEQKQGNEKTLQCLLIQALQSYLKKDN